jgi:hypothetical protein
MIGKFTHLAHCSEEGDYFSGNQFVATDCAFEGDGIFWCSYTNPLPSILLPISEAAVVL